jgi:microcystin-dependent protein
MKPRTFFRPGSLTFFAVASIAMLAASLAWSAPPEVLRLQGTITSLEGAPVEDGDYVFRAEIYDGAGPGATLLYEQEVTATVSGGAYTLVLFPDQAGDLSDTFTEGPRFLEITVVSGPPGPIGETLQPRQEIASVPFALNASGGSWSSGDIKIAAYDPTSPPSGWLNCDGDLYDGSQPEYADLYDAIGEAFNIGGEIGDQFRVPDMQGKFPAGHDSDGNGNEDFAEIGQEGGDKSHDHGGDASMSGGDQTAKRGGYDATAAKVDHTHTLNSDDHIPPYMTVGFLIKL